MNVHVLIPAAGSGSRIGGDIRKQYLELGDRPVLVQTLSSLAAQPQIYVHSPGCPGGGCRHSVEPTWLMVIGLEKIGG